MKKLLFSLCVLVLSASAFAQTDKGRILVGVDSGLGFSSTSFEGNDDNSNNFGLNLNGGYFILDNLVAGANISFSRTSFDDFTSTQIGFGPFVRGYFEQVFAQVGINFLDVNTESDGTEFDTQGNTTRFSLGYAAFINDNISVEPALNYELGGGDAFDGRNTFSLSVGFAIYLP